MKQMDLSMKRNKLGNIESRLMVAKGFGIDVLGAGD